MKKEEILSYVSYHYGSDDTSVNTIIRLFLRGSNIAWVDKGEACAWYDLQTKTVYFNKPMFIDEVAKICMVSNVKTAEDMDEIIKYYKMGLFFHEVGHGLYSPTLEQIQLAFNTWPDIPDSFKMFCTNVIEDVFIQTQFLKDYPAKDYKKAIVMLQKHSQGENNIQSYLDEIKDTGGVCIHNQLFWIILKFYNPFSIDVGELRGNRDKIAVSDATLELCHKALCITDCQHRLNCIIQDVVPALWNDLKSQQTQLPPPPKGGGKEGEGPQGPQGPQGPGGGPGGDPGKKGGRPGKPSDQPGKGGGGAPQQDQPGKGQPQDGENGTENNQKGGEQKGGSGGGGAGSGDGEFKNAVDKACQELNKKLGTSNLKEKEISNTMKNKATEKSAIMNGCGVVDDNVKPRQQNFNNYTQQLLDAVRPDIGRIFNLHNDTLTRLEDGEFDENLAVEWYTEKNHELFYRQQNLVQDRNIKVAFIVDCSGSMSGARFSTTTALVAALSEAFEEHSIRTSTYVFSGNSIKIKAFSEPIESRGCGNKIYDYLVGHGANGGTNPSAAFKALVDDPEPEDDDAKILIFLTDGSLDRNSSEQIVQESITELISRNWKVWSIGIDFSDSSLKQLQRFTKGGLTTAYDTDELIGKLGMDIYQEIVTNFILN